MRVSVLDGIHHLSEELQTLSNRESAAVAVSGQRHAVNILQRQVGLTILRKSGIEQARDVRVSQIREDFPFPGQPLGHDPPRQRRMDELQGYAPREQTVSSLGQPNASHAAVPE